MRKIKEKLMNMETIMKNTDQQIAEIVTTQKVIRCEKVNAPPLPSKKKSNKKDQPQSQIQNAGNDVAGRKRTCKSDTESEADEDVITEKVILQSQQFQQADKQIQDIISQQNQMKETQQETKTLLSKMFEMLTGGPSASSLLEEDDEVFEDAEAETY
jgi:hypothetical protein